MRILKSVYEAKAFTTVKLLEPGKADLEVLIKLLTGMCILKEHLNRIGLAQDIESSLY